MPLSEHIPPAANPQVRPDTRIRHTQPPAVPRTPARPPRQASCRRYAPRTTGADRTGGASRQNGRHPKKTRRTSTAPTVSKARSNHPIPVSAAPAAKHASRGNGTVSANRILIRSVAAASPAPERVSATKGGSAARGNARTAQKRKHRHKDNQNFFHGNSILFTVVPHSPSPDTPPEAQHPIPRRTPDRRNLSGPALQTPKTDKRRYPQPDDKERTAG